MGNWMLPDLRFVLGAALATALLVVTAFGVATTLRLAHQAKVGPLEASRSLAYADQTDWNQFQDPTATRRFEDMTRAIDSESVQPSLEPPADVATGAPQPVAPSPILETPAPDTTSVPPGSTLATGVAQDANETSGVAQDANVIATVAQDAIVAASIPQNGNATPIADDHASHVDLEPVIAPAAATTAPLPEAAAAIGASEAPTVEVAALDPPATVPATIEPVIAAPAPMEEPPAANEVDRVASIPAISPGSITAVEPSPPLPRAAPARRQMAKLAPQAKRVAHRSRLFAARARALRVARARIARARAAAQQPYTPTGFTATGQPNNQFNNYRFNTTGFNNARPAGSPGGN